MTTTYTPTHGDSSLPGELRECAYCDHESRDGEHVWLVDEDYGAWSCEDDAACYARVERSAP